MQNLVERLTGIRFRNAKHYKHASTALCLFSGITLAAACAWQVAVTFAGPWLLLGSFHIHIVIAAIENVRRGTRQDVFSPDCIWFNGIMALANLGMFGFIVWLVLR